MYRMKFAKHSSKSYLRQIVLLPRKVLVVIIEIYQKTLSPDHGPFRHLHPHGYCRFRPTCSMYGKEAVTRHGVCKGGLMALWRIMRCNPCSRGGHDPVTEEG